MMEHSIGLLRKAFLERLEGDYFGDLKLDNVPGSVGEFVDFLTAGNVMLRNFRVRGMLRLPDLTDLNVRFESFLEKKIELEGETVPVATLFRNIFCVPVAAALAVEVASSMALNPLSNTPGQSALRELNVQTWSEWAKAVERPDRVVAIAAALCNAARTLFMGRPLLSFFIRGPVVGKFSMWRPHAKGGQVRKLQERTVQGEGYSVTVRVFPYEKVECAVTAYDWEATLTIAGAVEPDAVACGMIYVFEREDGEPVGGLEDLLIASSSTADGDVIHVKSFVTQHDDAADLIATSDLCFVCLWERRGGAFKGLGAKCLVPALQDIRCRFNKVRTVVFDARPGQFSNWTSRLDPPMVALEKQTAVENLVGYIESLKLKFDTRTVFSRADNPDDDALAAIEEEDDHSHDDEIDLAMWGEAVSDLLRLAGLEELAEQFDDDEAAHDEIVTVVKHLVFESRVHYLRASSSGHFQPSYADMLEEVPHAEAHKTIEGMDDFCSELPQNMRVSAVYWLDDYAICTVRATTPFGVLTEHFTLVRKPRPVNIDSFFEKFF
jgi:hypothetical protein